MVLTAKQQIFVNEYMIDLNATQAAIRAGYSPATAKDIGCQNLAKFNIRARIDQALAERSAKIRHLLQQVSFWLDIRKVSYNS